MAVDIRKYADDPTAPVRAQAAASPIPQITVPTLAAPAGKKGPVGISPRQNYSRVNTGAPSALDAGASEQKSLTPKYGSTMAYRPTLQDMIKSAAAGALSRDRISKEAQRQAEAVGDSQVAEETNQAPEKTASSTVKVSTAYANKVADALTFLASEATKEAAGTAPPAHMSEKEIGPGTGPGALELTHATASTAFPFQPGNQGKGHIQPPQKPPMEKVLKPEHGDSAMGTNMNEATPGKAPEKIVGKHASAPEQKTAEQLLASNMERIFGKTEKSAADLTAKNLARLGVKVAEDAINPAHISAGKAVPPETSAAGEPGGQPAGGKPQGAMGLVGTNEGAIKYTKGQAKADPKSDLHKYLSEPALTSSTDSTLRQAFTSTGKAGTKFASADDATVKTAAARAILEKLLTDTKAA